MQITRISVCKRLSYTVRYSTVSGDRSPFYTPFGQHQISSLQICINLRSVQHYLIAHCHSYRQESLAFIGNYIQLPLKSWPNSSWPKSCEFESRASRNCRWGSECTALSQYLNTTTEVPLSKALNSQLLTGCRSINGCPCSGCVFTLDGINAEHKLRVWVTILGHTSLHFHLSQLNSISTNPTISWREMSVVS